jgi:small ligand-binding sensory domain FIST
LIGECLGDAFGPEAMIGTTAGGILGDGEEREGEPGIAVLAAHLPGAVLRTFTYEQLDWPAAADSPDRLRANLMGDASDAEPAALMMMADPFSVPMSKLLPAIDQATGGAPVIGGMCSGSLEAGGNRLLLNGGVQTMGGVGVAIAGPVQVDATVSQGCRPIGPPLVVTDTHKNLIRQLGGRPVMQVVRDIASELDEQNRALMQDGLLVGRVVNEYKERFGRGDFLIRNVIGVGPDESYLAVSDFFRVGQTVQFHVRDARTAEEDLHLLLDAQAMHGEPAGIFLCTCNGRGEGMFGQTGYESDIIRRRLGTVPIAGFFAAGEIGPIGRSNFVHGFTASMALFRSAGQS